MSSNSNDVKSLFRSFFDEVNLCGAKEFNRTNFRFIKFCWLLIVCIGSFGTAHYLYDIFVEYNTKPIATKTEFNKSQFYDYPNIVLCPDAWVETEYLDHVKISLGAIGFGLSHIYRIKGLAFLLNSTKWSKYAEEFSDFLNTHNISDYRDFYILISKSGYRFFGEVNHYRRIEIGWNVKTVFNGFQVCYQLKLPKIDCSHLTTNREPAVRVFFHNNSDPFDLPNHGYHTLQVNPDLKLSDRFPPNSKLLESGKLYLLNIFPKKYFALSKPPDQPCVSVQHESHEKYSQLFCHSNCIENSYREIYNSCVIANLYQPYLDSSKETKNAVTYCNTLNYIYGEVSDHVLDRCNAECWPPCETDLFEVSLSHVAQSVVVSRSDENFGSAVEECYERSELHISYDVCGKGIMEIREFQRYTLENLVADIGGVLGLWLGASAVTFAQLFMCALEMALLKLSKLSKIGERNTFQT